MSIISNSETNLILADKLYLSSRYPIKKIADTKKILDCNKLEVEEK